MSLEDQITELVQAVAEGVLDRFAERLDRLERRADHKLPDKLLYTEKDAAKALGIAHLTLKGWRCRGLVKASTSAKPILYRWSDIEAAAEWLAERNGHV